MVAVAYVLRWVLLQIMEVFIVKGVVTVVSILAASLGVNRAVR